MTTTIFSARRRQQQRQRAVLSMPLSVGVTPFATMTIWIIMVVLLTAITVVMADADADADADVVQDETEYYQSRRASAKPWLMKEFQLFKFPDNIYLKIVSIVESQGLFDTEYVPRQVFVSPFTIILVTLVVANVWGWISYHLSGSWVEASHILVKDTSPKTLKALVSLREQLGKDNPKLFGQTAKQYSQCPSSEQNGDLGRFGEGVMAPPFDKLCFDSETPLNTTVGPVQTQFGYHLIYIRKRKF